MKIILAVINLLALIGATIWWISNPDWEPAVTTIGLFGGLLAQAFTNEEIKTMIRQKIISKNDSHIYQAGGDQTINDNKKTIKHTKNSENYQGDVVVINKGLSYDETKSIALDVYRANMMEFKSIAFAEANARAEEITEKILSKLAESGEKSFDEFQKPGMQDALFRTQKEYAMSGDREIGDLLVDIISDRAKTPTRNMLQLVLDEALNIAPKITIEQLDTLTLNFLLVKTKRLGLRTFEEFKEYLNTDIFPFVDNLQNDMEHYNFLEYLRCGQIRTGDFGKLETIFRRTYKAFFSKGFTQDELELEFEDKTQIKVKIINCFHDMTKFQIGVLDDNTLESEMNVLNVNDDIKVKLRNLFERTTMSENEVKNLLTESDEKMKKIFETWDNSYFKNFDLSSMGIAIAHANYRRKTNKTMNISIWIK